MPRPAYLACRNVIYRPLSLLTAFAEIAFDPDLETDFRARWREKTFDKGAFLSESGRTERWFYFVLEGIQAVYLIDRKGRQTIFGFSYAGDFSGDFISFIEQQPGNFYIEALTPSRLLALSYADYEDLFARYPAFAEWERQFLRRILVGRFHREVELLTKTAEERYRAFVTRRPDELLRIPQKYLAGYLNMTPETYSRLRGKVR